MPNSRQIITSVRAAERIAAARNWLSALEPGAEAIVIAPVRAGADDLVRALAAERGALAGIHRLTFNRLAGLLAADRMAALGLAPASELAARALAARAVFHLRTDTGLQHFAPVLDQPGFATALARTLEELRLNGISADDLTRLGPAGAELGAMLTRFEFELSCAGLADRAQILALAAEAVRAEPAPRFAALPTLMLDVGIETRRECALAAALAARAPDFFATLPAGAERAARMLSESLGVAVQSPPRSADGAETSLARTQDYLFGDLTPPARALDDSVTIISAPGEMHECVEIARRIDQEARSGVRFDKIAVLLHDPVRYLPCLQEALARAGIPAHFALGARRPRPAGRALLALLACAAENLSARRYAEYLSLAQVPGDSAPRDAPAPAAAPDSELFAGSLARDLEDFVSRSQAPEAEDRSRAPWRWERIIVAAAVIGSAARWTRRLDGLGREFARRRAALDDDTAQAAGLEHRIADLRHLKEIALPHIAMLAALPPSASWGEWLRHLRAIAAAAIRDSDEILAALAELDAMAPVGPVTLDEVRHVVAERLAQLEDPPAPRRYGAVFVAAPHRAAAMSFEVVIVPGLAERIFPRKLIEDPILLDAARAALGADLIRNEDRVARERLALRIAVGAAERRVMFSHPRVDLDQGRPRVPSFYALEILRAAEGRLPGFDELARRAAMPAAAGWPAPTDPEQAIDDAEFDLATLDKLIGRDPETTRGAAHYLLGANQYLGRALRTRARRWLKRWTPADGLVDPEPAARAALEPHQLAARSYSPTALQHFAACPYRFFLQAIHRLEPREEPAAIEVIDPLTRGGLFAEVQYEILVRLRAGGALPVTGPGLAAASTLLDATLDEVAARWREELAPAIERVWLDGIESIRADLREWLRRAAEDPEAWRPERFELSFGLSDRAQADPASAPAPAALEGGLMLRGSIDLVERASDGRLRVTDHKTGRVRAAPDFVIGGGKYLQPVFYALAAERVLGEPVALGRLYYCTATGGYEERIVEMNDAARAAEREFAVILGAALAEGFLPAAPADRECEWCDYRRVCGPYEERRVKDVKPKGRLDALMRLRKMK
ncbi:MAG TPA: PD-(D/E)XK nuclease family protein [Candidatus Binataceae bacterium]|nr:PD-(D/E)XK nuclease family protein [Candidatus Binataceae bacterium]